MKRLLCNLTFLFLPCLSHGAWASIGSLGTFTQNSSTVAWTVATTATLEAGNVGVCIWASDNDGNGTDTDDFTTMTDSSGNTWTSIGENETDPGANNAGAVVSIFYTKATTQLSSGGTLTINNATAETSRAGTCWEFTIGAGNVVTSTGTEQKEDTALDAGSLTLGSLGTGQHLWIRAVASETTDGGTTVTASYTVITAATNNTGTEATSMGAVGEFIIATGTSSTSDPKMNDLSADRASSMVALNEEAPAASTRNRVMVIQ